jgi:hypothetical protein
VPGTGTEMKAALRRAWSLRGGPGSGSTAGAKPGGGKARSVFAHQLGPPFFYRQPRRHLPRRVPVRPLGLVALAALASSPVGIRLLSPRRRRGSVRGGEPNSNRVGAARFTAEAFGSTLGLTTRCSRPAPPAAER